TLRRLALRTLARARTAVRPELVAELLEKLLERIVVRQVGDLTIEIVGRTGLLAAFDSDRNHRRLHGGHEVGETAILGSQVGGGDLSGGGYLGRGHRARCGEERRTAAQSNEDRQCRSTDPLAAACEEIGAHCLFSFKRLSDEMPPIWECRRFPRRCASINS